MKKLIGKTITIFLLMAVVVSNLPVGTIAAAVRPSVSVSAPSTTSVTEGSSVSYTVTFSNADDVKLSASYVNLNGFTANVGISGNGNTRTITLSNVQGTAGRKTISIKSGAAKNATGNSLATPNSVSFTLSAQSITPSNPTTPSTPSTPSTSADRVRPSVSVSAPSATTINVGGTVKYTITFADNTAVTRVNLSSAYVNLNGFTADVAVSGSGNARTVTLSNVQGTAGRKTISIKAGAAEDAAGNASIATPNSVSFTLVSNSASSRSDNVRPSISISEPSVREVYAGGSVSYVITFADNRAVTRVNLSQAYLIFNGFTADVTITGSGNTRTVTLSNVQGEVGKNYNIVVKAGAAEDAAGNGTIQTPHSISFQIIQKGSNSTPNTNTNDSSKLDGEPNTGVESLPVLPIMGGAAAVLTTIGYVVTKKIYG